jgi:hypothetical protein
VEFPYTIDICILEGKRTPGRGSQETPRFKIVARKKRPQALKVIHRLCITLPGKTVFSSLVPCELESPGKTGCLWNPRRRVVGVPMSTNWD